MFISHLRSLRIFTINLAIKQAVSAISNLHCYVKLFSQQNILRFLNRDENTKTF